MSKSPRKSIVANFGLLSAELENDQASALESPSPAPVARVGAGVIGAAHRAIDDIRAERDRLRAIFEAGGGAILELDPNSIDPSPYPDRLPDDDAGEFEVFKRSIENEGQKVPIQVRRHPSSADRYQIVFGHRRWRAARELGTPVRALQVDISDLDLVVAQGIENASRQDLTWIERALFASRMDDAGIKPRDIYAALSIEDAELARMRSVYRAIPTDIIEAIGRAPKVGRPRWMELAKTILNEPDALEAARIELAKVTGPSDQRFQRISNVVKPVVARQSEVTPISNGLGTRVGAYRRSPKEVRISAEGALGAEFIRYVEEQLPALAEQFTRQRKSSET
ncbi:Chromosome-partitioning protein ParB [Ensifer adhaerens]|uniref:plasmid partitioning protein RepB n=1 Tax=Ensifer adhaerens TaxID=106592 RepID=UPI001568FDE0|nr:plasmid partitioning protein RepB [Ensifer adhaerens]NRP21804.1 Chromosome-partitioning protein ParB [Ensifer adhaerens]